MALYLLLPPSFKQVCLPPCFEMSLTLSQSKNTSMSLSLNKKKITAFAEFKWSQGYAVLISFVVLNSIFKFGQSFNSLLWHLIDFVINVTSHGIRQQCVEQTCTSTSLLKRILICISIFSLGKCLNFGVKITLCVFNKDKGITNIYVTAMYKNVYFYIFLLNDIYLQICTVT